MRLDTRVAAAVRRRIRARLLRRARAAFPVLGVEHAGVVFVLPSDDATILAKLFVEGSRSEFVVLARAMEVLAATGGARTEVFVDVGANLGTTTLAALELHGFDRAVAIEPDPENVRFLRATVAANGFDDRVAVVEAAVADHVGEAAFAARAAAPGGRKSGSGGLSAGGGDLVGVTTLDALAEQGLFRPEQVGLLWMDAQGAEGHALAGAGRLLDYRVPVVSAVRPRRLAKLGGLEMFRELVRARYPQFVDLRAPNLEPGWSAVVRPVADLDELLTGESTDVLLLP